MYLGSIPFDTTNRPVHPEVAYLLVEEALHLGLPSRGAQELYDTLLAGDGEPITWCKEVVDACTVFRANKNAQHLALEAMLQNLTPTEALARYFRCVIFYEVEELYQGPIEGCPTLIGTGDSSCGMSLPRAQSERVDQVGLTTNECHDNPFEAFTRSGNPFGNSEIGSRQRVEGSVPREEPSLTPGPVPISAMTPQPRIRSDLKSSCLPNWIQIPGTSNNNQSLNH